MKRDVWKYILEAFIVVFGVVLGLLLAQWTGQSKARKDAKVALAGIIQELETNIRQFETAIEYHEKLKPPLDSIERALTEEQMAAVYYTNDVFRHFRLPGWRGMGTVQPNTIMFESARISGVIQEFNLGTIQHLSRIYRILERYQVFCEKTEDLFFTLDSESRVADAIMILLILESDILSMEVSLRLQLENEVSKLKTTLLKREYLR
ncbi:MAG: hypothetical protein R2751_05630 [Bacteroidales bacterium]